MKINPGSLDSVAYIMYSVFKEERKMLTPEEITAIIDTYDLRDCVVILSVFAPDLLESISYDVYYHPHDPKTLELARRAVHEARAREKRLN